MDKTNSNNQPAAPTTDPRVVFALVGFLSMAAVITRNLGFMLVLLLVAMISAILLKTGFVAVFKRLKRLWQLIIMVAILQSLFSPSGAALLKIGGVTLLSEGGLRLGLIVLLRMSILIFGGTMMAKYQNRVLIQGMIQLRVPYEIAYMVSVGIRFIPMIMQQLKDNLTAIELRGVEYKKLKLKKRFKVYVYLLLPSVAGCLNNANGLAMSMEMRGFRAYPTRTSYLTLAMTPKDYRILIAVFLLLVIYFSLYIIFSLGLIGG